MSFFRFGNFHQNITMARSFILTSLKSFTEVGVKIAGSENKNPKLLTRNIFGLSRGKDLKKNVLQFFLVLFFLFYYFRKKKFCT